MKMNLLTLAVMMMGSVSANAKWGGTRYGTEPLGAYVDVHCEDGKGSSLDFKYDETAGNFASWSYSELVTGHCPSRNCGSNDLRTYSGSTDEAGITAMFVKYSPNGFLLKLNNPQNPDNNFAVEMYEVSPGNLWISNAQIGGVNLYTSNMKCTQK